ncbi:hypothetical protein TRFO_06050 [Tritrichomonas foetus]|uniref:Uncharacterized protein n=1 Tax=Tritrichomonas foetus TaxID=1144522 RepID=A0A1J4K5Q5_9EUKA|nr:hypothetical protein TRFO_06050 [Tritrichomonas foetus]|eukprot:OHT05060.1 hypothetical protein TRFO_06050 [Tritrichomonas foetus]
MSDSKNFESGNAGLPSRETTQTSGHCPFQTHVASASNNPASTSYSDNQIDLALRQPSFASLCGSMVTKNGQEILEQKSVESPTIVFDNSRSGQINNPLGQIIENQTNSFSSLYSFVTSEKPGKAIDFPLADSKPVEIKNEIKENSSQNNNNLNNLSTLNVDDEEDDQNIKVLKRLQNNNAERWKKIGYVPRQNIVPMCKTISHLYRNNLNQLNLNSPDQMKFSQSFAIKKVEKCDDDEYGKFGSNFSANFGAFGKDIRNISGGSNQNYSLKRARCNSNERITPIKSQVSIVAKKSDDKPLNEKSDNTSESPKKTPELTVEALLDYHPVLENHYKIDLFGRLDQIITDPEIAHFLNKVPPTASPEMLRKLSQLVVQCGSKLWMEEVHYLNSIISNFRDSSQALQSQLNDIERLYDSEVDAIECQAERKANIILREYLVEAKRLDDDFKSEDAMLASYRPSEEVLELRKKLRDMPKDDPAHNELQTKIDNLKAKEIKEAREALNNAYVEADRRMKERCVLRRALSRKKADLKIEEAETKRNRAIERLKQAQILREKIQKAIALDFADLTEIEGDEPLCLMDRSGDINVLNHLTQMVLDGNAIDDTDYDTPRISSK